MYDVFINITVLFLFLLPVTIIYFVIKRTDVAKKVVLYNFIAIVLMFFAAVLVDVIDDESDTNTTPNVSPPTQNSTQPTQDSTPPIQDTTPSNIIYKEVTTDMLVDELKENALRADASYNDEHIKLTGKLYSIDSSGKYFNLEPMNDPWSFTSITCYVTDDSQLDQIIQMNKGDIITISGQVTLVGEVLGYSIDIHTIH